MKSLTNMEFITVMESLEEAIREMEEQNHFLKKQLLELTIAKRDYMKTMKKEFEKEMSIRR